VPLKDRLTKSYDAEMMVSRDDWNLMNEAHRLALLDHELSHLEPVKRKAKRPKGRRRTRRPCSSRATTTSAVRS
jgi:hypothetical protein